VENKEVSYARGVADNLREPEMRIAYITPYQGPTVIERRPIVRNRSVSNRVKIELIAQLLQARGHEVEIISHGEVIENQLRFYAGFSEPELFDPGIPVYYLSALPIRRLNGFWAAWRARHFLKRRHQARPFDLVIVFNMKPPQISCADYAVRSLGIPVVLQYEDDVFVTVEGKALNGCIARRQRAAYERILREISGCLGVSPHLLAQAPSIIPKLLLRGVVGDDVFAAGPRCEGTRRNWVVFAGTHIRSNGVEELIAGWKQARPPQWELHITGFGGMTERLKEMATDEPSVVFHGFVSREELVCLITSAKICVNPHAVSETPGNVFAFKIIEYLAAGAHVLTTPMGALEPELERGITYIPNNQPATIATALKELIDNRAYERTAAPRALTAYGTCVVSESLDELLRQVTNAGEKKVDSRMSALAIS
jgi:glycosyltransferase involved in cell wall biosynthesis